MTRSAGGRKTVPDFSPPPSYLRSCVWNRVRSCAGSCEGSRCICGIYSAVHARVKGVVQGIMWGLVHRGVQGVVSGGVHKVVCRVVFKSVHAGVQGVRLSGVVCRVVLGAQPCLAPTPAKTAGDTCRHLPWQVLAPTAVAGVSANCRGRC